MLKLRTTKDRLPTPERKLRLPLKVGAPHPVSGAGFVGVGEVMVTFIAAEIPQSAHAAAVCVSAKVAGADNRAWTGQAHDS